MTGRWHPAAGVRRSAAAAARWLVLALAGVHVGLHRRRGPTPT